MNSVSVWVLQIIGLVVVGVIIDIVFGGRKLCNILKTIVAVFLMIVIISPLKTIDFNNFNINNFTNPIEIDKDMIEEIQTDLVNAMEKDIEKSLENNGFMSVKIQIDCEQNDETLNIKTIFVDLTNMVLLSENLNIDKYTKIIAIISKEVTIEREDVVFYE